MDAALPRIADKVKGSFKISPDGFALLGEIVDLIVHFIYIGSASEGVSSESLMPIFEALLGEGALTSGQQLLIVWFALDLRRPGALGLAESVLRGKRMTQWGLRLIAEKLGAVYFLRSYRQSDERQLENLIAEYHIALGKDRRLKGQLVQRIHKYPQADAGN